MKTNASLIGAARVIPLHAIRGNFAERAIIHADKKPGVNFPMRRAQYGERIRVELNGKSRFAKRCKYVFEIGRHHFGLRAKGRLWFSYALRNHVLQGAACRAPYILLPTPYVLFPF